MVSGLQRPGGGAPLQVLHRRVSQHRHPGGEPVPLRRGGGLQGRPHQRTWRGGVRVQVLCHSRGGHGFQVRYHSRKEMRSKSGTGIRAKV